MEGVEILKTVEITEIAGWIVPALIISILICVISSGCISSVIHENIPASIAIVSAIAALIFLGFLLFSKPIPNGKYKYDVQVSKDVSFIEFYEQYEILDKYDYTNIYIVKERIEK